MHNFIFDAYDELNAILLRNFAPPGIGKTYTMVELIHEHPEEQFVIVIPNHSMAMGNGDLEDMLDKRNIQWIHVFGKKQGHSIFNKYCLRPDGEEYYPGCSFSFNPSDIPYLEEKYDGTYRFDLDTGKTKCSHASECPYKHQFVSINNTQVVICVLEHMSMFDDRVLVFDESFEQKLLASYIVNKEQIADYGIRIEHEETVKLGREKFKFYKTVSLDEVIQIHNQESYFLAKFFQSTNHINAYRIKSKKSAFKGKYCLFGIRTNYLPNYTRLFFNCATTPLSLMYKITGTEIWGEMGSEFGGWIIYESEEFSVKNLENPMIKINHTWSKDLSTKWLDKAIEYFRMFGDRNLIVTKKGLKQKFIDRFPNSKFVHFNAGRGFNSVDDENRTLIIQYGRFGFTPLNREMWRRIGFDKALVDQMEESEMLQCLHRGRPILHPHIPILMMSDQHLFPHVDRVSVTLLGLFRDHYDIDLDLPIKEIMEKMEEKNKNKIYQYKKFVKFIRKYIYKLD